MWDILGKGWQCLHPVLPILSLSGSVSITSAVEAVCLSVVTCLFVCECLRASSTNIESQSLHQLWSCMFVSCINMYVCL